MEIKFLTNEPAILLGKALVISDLHLGIEYEYYQSGIKIPSQTRILEKRIGSLLKKTKAKKLFILGDIKHKVPGTSFQEEREIPEFFHQIQKNIELEILPGNHDADLRFLVPNLKILSSKGHLLHDFYLAHGHTWPSKSFLKSRYIIIGHDHPAIEFKSRIGYRWIEQVWAKAKLNAKTIMDKYELKQKPKTLPELILIPAFNEFSGAIPLNRSLPRQPGLSPITKASKIKEAEITLLDGTFLGLLKNLQY